MILKQSHLIQVFCSAQQNMAKNYNLSSLTIRHKRPDNFFSLGTDALHKLSKELLTSTNTANKRMAIDDNDGNMGNQTEDQLEDRDTKEIVPEDIDAVLDFDNVEY